MIDMVKKTLILYSSLIIAVILSLSLIFTLVDFNRPKIEITSINPADMGVEEWLYDFNHFYDFISKNYPYLALKERTHGYNWLDLKTVFEDKIRNATNNEEFLLILIEAVQALQNRHTEILSPGEVVYSYYNFREITPYNELFTEEVHDASQYWSNIYRNCFDQKYWNKFDASIVYTKGSYIIHNPPTSFLQLYGENSKIVEVNGQPIDGAIETCFESDYIDWDFNRNKKYIWRIAPRSFGDNAIFTIINSTGYEADVTFNTSFGYSGNPYPKPYSTVHFSIWEDTSTAYFYIDTFELDDIEPYEDAILDFYSQIQGYDNLIIDIRGNTGGYYETWVRNIVRPLIEEEKLFELYLAYKTDRYSDYFREALGVDKKISRRGFDYLPPEVYEKDFKIYENYYTYTPTHPDLDFNGNIYLLTDNVVYSAAEAFCIFCKQTGFATIYGIPSGGDGIMYFPLFYVLPNSKIVVKLASALGLDETGHANEEVRTQPDIYYESSYGNCTELIDYVINQI
jgi:C-terminal processing protease CtpA/Prc